MRFPSSKYTKMRLRLGLRPDPTAGANYSVPQIPAGGDGAHHCPSPKLYPRSRSALRASSFRISALGLKEVVHHCFRSSLIVIVVPCLRTQWRI